MDCPRCGNPMNLEIDCPALSRHATADICTPCAIEEAMLGCHHKPPLSRDLWADRDAYVARYRALDQSKLPTKEEVFGVLYEHGANEQGIGRLEDLNTRRTGLGLIWRYPLGDVDFNGAFLVPFRDGVLWIPYLTVTEGEGAQLELEQASLMGVDNFTYCLQELQTFAESFSKIMRLLTFEQVLHSPPRAEEEAHAK